MKKTALLLLMILMTGCSFDKKIDIYKEAVDLSGVSIILKEVAFIDSLQYEDIRFVPQAGNVLLVSVVEVLNGREEAFNAVEDFRQSVVYQKQTFDSQVFSLDNALILPQKQAYIYLVSEMPETALSDLKSDKISVGYRFLERGFVFSGEINNNYPLQENISVRFPKIREWTKDFDGYWGNDLQGFKNILEMKQNIKNYSGISDWVDGKNNEYEQQVGVLDLYIEEMKNIKMLTPIYPNANIKILSEAMFLRNRLNAIISVENTCTNYEGVLLYLKNCAEVLHGADVLNAQFLKEIEIEIVKEKSQYRLHASS